MHGLSRAKERKMIEANYWIHHLYRTLTLFRNTGKKIDLDKDCNFRVIEVFPGVFNQVHHWKKKGSNGTAMCANQWYRSRAASSEWGDEKRLQESWKNLVRHCNVRMFCMCWTKFNGVFFPVMQICSAGCDEQWGVMWCCLTDSSNG